MPSCTEYNTKMKKIIFAQCYADKRDNEACYVVPN